MTEKSLEAWNEGLSCMGLTERILTFNIYEIDDVMLVLIV